MPTLSYSTNVKVRDLAVLKDLREQVEPAVTPGTKLVVAATRADAGGAGKTPLTDADLKVLHQLRCELPLAQLVVTSAKHHIGIEALRSAVVV